VRSTVYFQVAAGTDAYLTDAVATSSDDEECNGGGMELLAVPRPHFLTVDNMLQAVSIETLTSDEESAIHRFHNPLA